MQVNVVLPEIAESLPEMRITRWMKQVGDAVKVDEPLFTVTTDKVDFDVPAPASGVLIEIRGEVGRSLAPLTVVAVIDAPE